MQNLVPFRTTLSCTHCSADKWCCKNLVQPVINFWFLKVTKFFQKSTRFEIFCSPAEQWIVSGTSVKTCIKLFFCFSDPNSLYVPHPDMENFAGAPLFFTMKQNQPSIIECLPSYSKGKVELFNAANEPVHNSPDVTFDPTVGFTVQFPNVFFSGEFICRFETVVLNNRKQQNLSVFLHYLSKFRFPQLSLACSGFQTLEPVGVREQVECVTYRCKLQVQVFLRLITIYSRKMSNRPGENVLSLINL